MHSAARCADNNYYGHKYNSEKREHITLFKCKKRKSRSSVKAASAAFHTVRRFDRVFQRPCDQDRQDREPMARALLEALDLRPPIHADMALGEGTGAVMVYPLLDMALRVYAGEHTFGNLGMDAYEPQEGKP